MVIGRYHTLKALAARLKSQRTTRLGVLNMIPEKRRSRREIEEIAFLRDAVSLVDRKKRKRSTSIDDGEPAGLLSDLWELCTEGPRPFIFPRRED